jgi:hypothetical protein
MVRLRRPRFVLDPLRHELYAYAALAFLVQALLA